MTRGQAKAFVYRKLSKVVADLDFSDAVLGSDADVTPKTRNTYDKVRNAAAEIAERLARQGDKPEPTGDADSVDAPASA